MNLQIRSRRTRAGLASRIGLVLLVLLTLPHPALAQDERQERIDQAKAHFEAGSRLYAEKRYEEAVRELQAAYELTSETILLFNIAKSFEKMGDFDKAVRQYQDYLDLTPTLTATERAEVERTVQDLQRRKQELLPELVIRSNPRGADIYIDSRTKIRGQTPDKFRLESGPHRIFLEKKGFEPLEKDFVMPTGKPLILEFELTPTEEYGNVQVVANVTGARVFIDGKNVGITPYGEMPSLKIGFHQVILEKEGFLRWEQRVEVNKGRTTLVTADLKPLEAPSSAPAVLGWTSLVFGGLAIGGAVVANHFAEEEFNDTTDFETLHNLELAGYVSGGVLLTLATTLIIYDLVREDPTEQQGITGPYADRGKTPAMPLVGVTLDPQHRGLHLGVGFSF